MSGTALVGAGERPRRQDARRVNSRLSICERRTWSHSGAETRPPVSPEFTFQAHQNLPSAPAKIQS